MTRPGRNVFDLSHDVKMSMDMGYLVPTLALEVVPGDKISLSCESLLRFAPMISPVMHRINVYMHYWFVPNRIIWPEWEKWISNEMPTGTVAPYMLHQESNGYTPEQELFMDYFGIPPVPAGSTVIEGVSVLPFYAYNKIYNDFYRDQNLITEVNVEAVTGNNTSLAPDFLTLRKRAWEHDYFTSSLPFAQKGDAVDIPLGVVELTNDPLTVADIGKFIDPTTNLPIGAGAASIQGAGSLIAASGSQSVYDPNGTLSVGSTTINDLRRAFRLQEWLEKNARGGTRYAENILAHFGVKSDDARLQRAEYITGSTSPVVISEVLNTSATAEDPQGEMAGHGVSVTTGNYGSYYAKEHGYIIGIMSVMPKTAYQQGIPRHFLKSLDPLEYYWPSFANIGEQQVDVREIFAFSPNRLEPFGYVPRYAEYKYLPSRVAGEFRSSLAYWHLGRIFATEPALNQEFIECSPRKDIFAVEYQDVQSLFCHVFHKIKAVRPMPKYGTPTF